MQIVVNHLTRMQSGFICVAGIDPQSNTHIRPVLGTSRLSINLLRRNGGLFDIGALVDLGTTLDNSLTPEVEDRDFQPHQARYITDWAGEDFWALLQSVSADNLSAIFGDELTAQGNGCAIDEGKGQASLGCLLPPISPVIYINHWNKIRANLNDNTFSLDLSITDIRLYEEDHQTPNSNAVADIQRRIQEGVGVILSLGLARPFQARGDTVKRHWLQINNIHLEDNPIWQVS